MFAGITLAETHGKTGFKNEENTTHHMYISDYYKTWDRTRGFCVPPYATARDLQWCHTQLPAGVAMGSHVKRYSLNSVTLVMCSLWQGKQRKQRGCYALTSKLPHPQASALNLRQCSPEERQHSLRWRYFFCSNNLVSVVLTKYIRLKK